MEVKLISHTPDALNLLLSTKNTRLKFDSDPAAWTDAQRAEHLSYMRDTIKSSWEFCDYTFLISGVSRAFTHQLVRTRTGAYAQESQRTVDARGNSWRNPFAEGSAFRETYDEFAGVAFKFYASLVDEGAPVQDARGILPTDTLTSIVAKFSLRTLHEMAKVRLCTRTQGEYQGVFRAMRAAVIAVHPWVAENRFIEVHCVSEGTCAFPRYGKSSCKFYDRRMNLDALKDATHGIFWYEPPQVAEPVATDGKTM